MSERLNETQIESGLKEISQWTRTGDSLSRTVTLTSFPAALVFVSAVGHLAEAANHHPTMMVQYNRVILTISTHSAGGLTEKDFSLARQIDALPIKK